MSRFKGQRRIEHAIKHRDEDELRWALAYCRMRRSIAVRKDHVSHWTKVQRRVESVLGLSKA